jgi:hypothetical protein
MPGTFAVDLAATFKSVLLISSGPKMRFGMSGQQETNAAGVPKWLVEVAATFTPTSPGMPETSELLRITVTDHANPGDGVNPGTPIVLDGFRVGTNPPEQKEGGGIRGGRLWFTASGFRSAAASAMSARRPSSSGENAA